MFLPLPTFARLSAVISLETQLSYHTLLLISVYNLRLRYSFHQSHPATAKDQSQITSPTMTTSSPHLPYLQKCLSLAEQSPPRPTNFRVGAILLSRKDNDPTFADDRILSTGYTMELVGNTHAEQCCFSNYAAVHKVSDDEVASVLPVESGRKLIMYVTMEPCGKRLSGNAPCAQRIARTTAGHEGIHKVYFGVKEPETFVGQSEGCRMLTEAGIEWEHVGGLEREILTVAFAGHENGAEEVRAALGDKENTADESLEERQRQEAQQPRNPKKRMMEGETNIYM
ncbi:unnamed protein product [Penicillium olsonii]|nr:unnamed protein product [Penicillium olsonii]